MKLLQLALLALLAAPTLAAGLSEGEVRLKQQRLADPAMGGMVSHHLLVPTGWEIEGGAFWARREYFNVLPSQDIQVTAPGGASVRIEPTLVAKDYVPGGQYGAQRPAPLTPDAGYPVLYLPSDLAGWKRWYQEEIIGLSVEGASRIRVRNIVVVPELTFALAQAFAPVAQMIEQGNRQYVGMGLTSSTDCYVLGVESTYRLGEVDFEELRLLAVTVIHNDSNLTGRSTVWTVERGVTYRAPRGELEASLPLLKVVADSLQVTPEWSAMRTDLQARLMKIQREVAADNFRHAQKRAQIISQSSRDLSDIINGGYRERQAIQDRTHEKVIQSIRGTEEYVVPGGSEIVQLPHGYDHVYSNGSGEFLLTNDALLEPNGEPAINRLEWTRMSVRQ